MGPLLMLKITENDKRVIIALLFIIIILFVVIGLLGSLIIRTMKWQGKKCDTLVSDVVTNHIVKTPHQLRRYAAKKNIRHFIIIRNAVKNDWAYNPFNINDGFGSLFFVWDFSNIISTPESGIGVLLNWPTLINQPHFEVEAICSYVAVSFVIVGGLWYLVVAQAYLARTIRAIKLSKRVFEKSLDNFDQNTPPQQPQQSNNSPVQPM